jgi:hypothetical protein
MRESKSPAPSKTYHMTATHEAAKTLALQPTVCTFIPRYAFVVRLWRKSNEFVGQNYAVARIVMNMLDVQAMLHYQTYQDDENYVLQSHLFPKNASQSTQDSGLPLVLGLISEQSHTLQ